MRGGDLGRPRRTGRRVPGGGYFALGARLAGARRGRLLATVAALGAAVAVVLLMLSLARCSTGSRRTRRCWASATRSRSATWARARSSASVPGVAAVGERYQVDGADAFALGSPVRLIAYPGDHTRFESPPLASGRRVRAANEAEVGQGLAQALGLDLGATLAVEFRAGTRASASSASTARSTTRAASPSCSRARGTRRPGGDPMLAVRLDQALTPPRGPGADALGAPPQRAGGATTSTPRCSACWPTCCGCWRSSPRWSASTRSCRRWR